MCTLSPFVVSKFILFFRTENIVDFCASCEWLKQYGLVKKIESYHKFYNPVKSVVFKISLPYITLSVPHYFFKDSARTLKTIVHWVPSVHRTSLLRIRQESNQSAPEAFLCSCFMCISVMIGSAFSSSTWLSLFSIWLLCSSPRCQGQCALWSAQLILQRPLLKRSAPDLTCCAQTSILPLGPSPTPP